MGLGKSPPKPVLHLHRLRLEKRYLGTWNPTGRSSVVSESMSLGEKARITSKTDPVVTIQGQTSSLAYLIDSFGLRKFISTNSF